MPILELQQRARELGRIRIGHKVTGTTRDGKDYTRPAKLDRFRLTSPSKPMLERVAALYGGEVAEWTPQGGTQQWEVLTNVTRIPIMVPPQPVTQWLETWSRAGCVHRCDGATNVLTDEPCNPDDPDHINAQPTTRLNVVLRDVEGLGVWRLETHGWNAAVELPHAAQFLAQVGGYVNGWVALEERVQHRIKANGEAETLRFMVPTIEIDVTPAQLMAGQGAVAPPALAGPVAPALPPGAPAYVADYIAEAAACETLEQLHALWNRIGAAGHLSDGLKDHLNRRAADIKAAAASEQPPQPTEDEAPTWAESPQTAAVQGEGAGAEVAGGGPGNPAPATPTSGQAATSTPPPAQGEGAVQQATTAPAAPSPAPEPEAPSWGEDIVDGEVVEDPPEEPPVAPPAEQQAAAMAAQLPVPTDDPDAVWDLIVAEAGRRDIKLPDLQDDFTTFFGGTITSAEASGAELGQYLLDLRARA